MFYGKFPWFNIDFVFISIDPLVKNIKGEHYALCEQHWIKSLLNTLIDYYCTNRNVWIIELYI
jgi:hypothetical protein